MTGYLKTWSAALAGAVMLATAGVAGAIEIAPFEASAFETAKAEGKSVVVDVTASWCSTCRAQSKIIDTLAGKPEYKDILVLKVDYDKQKDEMRSLGAQSRSTLIAFKGAEERGRSVADTNPASVEKLFTSALGQ
ncbi:MAG: thioredoxin family protein [Alphaproteobacteria bacterium]|nr:thioredoxin family protein [Alphaproteobacteria bacterium]